MSEGPSFDLAELHAQIEGEVLSDKLSRMLYATDASPYQRLPLAVVRPRHEGDCTAIMRFAAANRIPLIPRAAGTSLAGQCVGDGLVVDFTRHMNRIVRFDRVCKRAWVDPGVIRDDLNDALRPHGLMFAPDPSTSNRCTVSGMMGNNAWGIHAPCYGATRDHVVSAEAVLSGGQNVRFGPVDARELGIKLKQDDLEGRIYRTVFETIDRYRETILHHFPRPDGIPRNAGYPLDVLALGQPWEKDGPAFNLAKFLCGSEGTLALVTKIEIDLVSLPARRKLLCIHFENLDEALESVSTIVPHRPSAMELLDRHILELTRHNIEQQRNRFWLEGDPAAVLLLEFEGDDNARLQDTVERMTAELGKRRLGYAYKVLDPPESERVWALRAAGLGLLMGMPSRAKAVTGIEDSAVPVAVLPAYVREIRAMMVRHGIDCVIFGPIGRGVLHLRPELDLSQEEDRLKFSRILDEVADLVIRYGGTITAKHGDGRLRAPFLTRLLGEEVFSLLREIKSAFDPLDLLNPGKLFDSPPITWDLRAGAADGEFSTYFDWSRQVGFKAATYSCNGAGVCLKSAGRGTMCPSYMATREEKDGTRGRANLFRQVMDSPGAWSEEGGELLREILDLCLSCKGCKSECPANVDMARMKAEFLQHHYDRTGLPWRARLIGNFDRFSEIAGAWPEPVNALLKWRWVKSLLGFHPERRLPSLAKKRLSRWVKRQEFVDSGGRRGETLLFNDPFSEFYEPHIAIAAYRVLQRLGYRVRVTPCLESGRIQISQGLLRQARKRLQKAVEWLYPHAAAGHFIIGLEPSEILTFRDEAVDLLEDETMKRKALRVAEQSLLFEEFIAREAQLPDKALFRPLPWKLMVHGHCHQKALVGLEPLEKALNLLPEIDIEFMASGCCGMAGAFGYEKEHYEVSLKIAELVLFPAIRQAPAGSLVVAPGTSCRQQIIDGLGIRAYHPAEVLWMALGEESLH